MKRLFETVERNINQLVDKNVAWSRCICDEDMQNAKSGTVNLHLTHSRKIPHNWLPASLKGSKLLCLAGQAATGSLTRHGRSRRHGIRFI